jgi:hypothetical protein
VEDHEATTRWQRGHVRARRVAASLSVWTDSGDVADVWRELTAGFVTETVPRRRTTRAPSTTEPQPGVVVTSLLHRRPDMTVDEFVAHWRDVHQPMSLRIHPQHSYVRNLVAPAVAPATAPSFDAICEEGFAALDDVLEPSRFFGADPASRWQDNARTIGDDVPAFLDTEHTVATIMRDSLLRDLSRGSAPAG